MGLEQFIEGEIKYPHKGKRIPDEEDESDNKEDSNTDGRGSDTKTVIEYKENSKEPDCDEKVPYKLCPHCMGKSSAVDNKRWSCTNEECSVIEFIRGWTEKSEAHLFLSREIIVSIMGEKKVSIND